MAITDKEMSGKSGVKDVWLSESFGRGAGVFLGRLTPGGARLFYFRYTTPTGDRVRLQLGSYSKDGGGGGLTLAEARRRAGEWSRLYRSGVLDLREHLERERLAQESAAAQENLRVAEERRAAEAAQLALIRRITIRGLFDQWKGSKLAPSIGTNGKRIGRKDGGAYIEAQFERRVFPTLGTAPAADVRKADLMLLLDGAVRDGRRRTANVLLASLKQMFSFAVARDLVERNPLESIIKKDVGGDETSRERVLEPDEVKRLAKAVPKANLSQRTAFGVWLMLATGCRVSEAMGARWEHVDRVAATWYLPTSKNERDHTIHLSAFALAQFDGLEALRERDATGALIPWVFPNRKGNGPLDIKTIGKQLADRQRPPFKRLKNRAKATGALALPGGRWTAHDLRRTAATMMAELGVSGDVIDECLNHVIESRVRRTYVRDRRLADQARAFDALGVRLRSLVMDEPTPGKTRKPRAAKTATVS